MSACIWYISKYTAPPAKASVGARGYMIMRELAGMGYRCVIVTSDSNHLAETPKLTSPYMIENVDGMQICWIRTMKFTVAKSLKRILSWLHFEWRLLLLPKSNIPTPDAIIVSSLSLLTILNGFLLRKKYGCKLVFEIRDIWPLTLTAEGGFSKKNPFIIFLAWIEKLGYKYSDVIVGTMPNLKEHVSNVLGYKKDVYCIPMGIDLSTLSDPPIPPKDYLNTNFPPEKFIVGYAGTVGITNALDNFFQCAQSLVNNDHILFVLIGDGDLKARYVKEFGHLPNLIFAPKVPKKMVQAVLSHCDLLYFSVYNSEVWRYGQSLNKITDYMLAGKPIIASYNGFPSMINEAGCGSYLPTNDIAALQKEILRYFSMSPNERKRIGDLGRSWILENRSYKILSKNYIDIVFPKK